MANAVFAPFLQGLLNAEYDLNTATIKVALVRSYTYNAAHATMADVTGAGGVVNASSPALTNATIAGGVFDADDTTVTTTASAVNHTLIVYQASAVTGGADVSASTQKLIAYFDTGSGLPIQPGSGSVSLTWSNSTNRIVKIG